MRCLWTPSWLVSVGVLVATCGISVAQIRPREVTFIDEDFQDGMIDGTLLGSASIQFLSTANPESQALALTEPLSDQLGVAWFHEAFDLENPFDLGPAEIVVEFDLFIRSGTSTVSGEGLSVIFQLGQDTTLRGSGGANLGTCFPPAVRYFSVAFDIFDSGVVDPESPCDGPTEQTCHVEINQNICPETASSLQTSVDFGADTPDFVSLGDALIPVHVIIEIDRAQTLEVFLQVEGDPRFNTPLKVISTPIVLPPDPPEVLLGIAATTSGANAGQHIDELTGTANQVIIVDDDFLRGDVNGSGQVDISDGISLLSHLFLGEPSPLCPDTADANDEGALSISGSVFLFSFLFLGGPPPPDPGPLDCGPDPTPDNLLLCEFGGENC